MKIAELPNTKFWTELSNLKVLFLHNNPIGRLEYLKYLSASPTLEILTMYDTPMSLKLNYRHHVVNAITTLKVGLKKTYLAISFEFKLFKYKRPSIIIVSLMKKSLRKLSMTTCSKHIRLNCVLA